MGRAAAFRRREAVPSPRRPWYIFGQPFKRLMLSPGNRNVFLLLLFTLGKGFQLSIGALSINLYAHSLGYSSEFIGVLTGMSAIGSLAAAIPVGLLADRFGRKRLLIVSGLLNPLTLVAIALSTSAPFLIVGGLANGVLASAYWVTNLPLLTESTSAERRVGVLALNSFLLLGVGSLGALVGGIVPELVGAHLHVAATSTVPLRWGVLAAAIIVFLPAPPLFWLRETRRAAPVKEQRQRAPVALFTMLLLPDVLFTTGEGATVGLLQIFFVLRFAAQPGALGALYTIAGLCGGAAALTAPRVVRRWGKLRTATTIQYLSVPVVLGIGFLPFFPLAAAAEFARNVLRGLFEPTYAAFALERVPSRQRATLSGFYSVTWSVGYSLGPAMAGWLQVHAGLSASFVVSAVCIGGAATLLRFFFPTALRHDLPSAD